MSDKKIGIIGSRVGEFAQPKETKDFETVDEVLAEDYCRKLISDKIVELKNQRLSMGGESELKSDAGGYLIKRKMLNTKTVIENYIECIYKRSSLPSRVRTYIEAICLPAVQQTVKHFKNEL